jgi:hypothetical protein
MPTDERYRMGVDAAAEKRAATPTTFSSVAENLSAVNGNLSKAEERLRRFVETVLGPDPRVPTNGLNQPEQLAPAGALYAINGGVNAAASTTNRIHNLLAKLEEI